MCSSDLETLLERIFLCIHLSQRERKKHRVVRKARTLCASSPRYRSFYPGRQTSVSLKTPQIVWGTKFALRRLCQTQDLIWIIHPSRIWSTGFLIICGFLIYIYIYIQYLFIAFAYHIYLCYCLFLDLCIRFALS